MSLIAHQTGKIRSGDVDIFYRSFGDVFNSGDNSPIIILHGSNYYDSYDWIEVADALARDRQVVAIDLRGSGQSGWSEHKDYSLDAFFMDIKNVSAFFGWDRPIVMGHSVSGRLSVLYGANFPEDVSRLIIVDSEMGKGNPGKYNVSVGNAPKVFKSVEEAMQKLGDRHSPPRFSVDRKRAELALREVDGGYVLTRDPDQKNTQSQAPGAPRPKFMNLDTWQALSAVVCPVTFIRGEKSDRNKPEYYDRLAREFPQFGIETIDSRHDIAFEAPAELVATVLRIIGSGR